MLHIRVIPTIKLDQQATKKVQRNPLHQAPIEVPDCLCSNGAQMQHQTKKGDNTFK